MLWGRDLQWWGATCGIFSFLFTVAGFLWFIGKRLAPHVRNRWSERSLTSLKRRIAKVQADLEIAESSEPLSDVENLGLTSIQFVLLGIAALSLMGQLILTATLQVAESSTAVTVPATHKLPDELAQLPLQVGIVFGISLAISGMLLYASGRISGFLSLRGVNAQNDLKSSLERLREKLKERTGGAA